MVYLFLHNVFNFNSLWINCNSNLVINFCTILRFLRTGVFFQNRFSFNFEPQYEYLIQIQIEIWPESKLKYICLDPQGFY